MAMVKKLGAAKSDATPSTAKVKVKVDKLAGLTLEGDANVPSSRMTDYSFLIYGEKGIGKTALAAFFPGAFFLCTEPGAKAQAVKFRTVPGWDHFVRYVDLLEKAADPKTTVVVDVIDLVYDFIYDAECKRLMINSPTDENDFGATWRKIRKGFRDQVIRILNLPGGKVFLSHDVEKEVELRDGSKIERVQPTMGKQAMGEVVGLMDVVGCYAYDGEDRVLHIKGHQRMVAKSRLERNFLIKGGTPYTADHYVESIPMGRSPKDSFKNLQRAFDNQQETPDGLPPRAAKPKFSIKRK